MELEAVGRTGADATHERLSSPRRSVSVRTLLILLVCAAVLPLIALSSYLIWRDADAERAAVQTALLDKGRSVIASLDREMESAITALETLRHNEFLVTGDLERFKAVAERVKADHPHWIGILLTRPDGQQVMNLAARPGQPLPNIGHYEVIQAVIQTKQPAVSELLYGKVGKVYLVGIDVPVLDENGDLKLILGLSIYASHFRSVLEQGLPQGWMAALIDYKNVVVARSADRNDENVGKPGNLQLDELGNSDEGLLDATSREGVPILTAVVRSPLSRWAVAVAVPASLVQNGFESAIRSLLVGGLLLLLVSVGLALMLGWRIVGPLEDLSKAAERIVGGERVDPRSSSLIEIERLATALEHAGAEQNHERKRREKAEAALRQSQRMEAIGQLTGGVAHDFNNLLMVISGNVEMARRRTGDAVARHLDHIALAANRGAALTRQLLSFSRRSALNPQVIDLRETLPRLRELVAHALRGDIALKMDVAEDTHLIEVDPGEFEIALLNLATNARDAMPEGGALWISAQNAHPNTETRFNKGKCVSISVSDTGLGIPEDRLGRIFEPFFTTKETGKGTGLGLSQVYGFATQSGGAVEVESVVGKGATFTLLLPCARNQTRSEDRSKEPLAGTRLADRRILVVEDNPEVRSAVVSLLASFGCQVSEAAGATEALALIEQAGAPDLLLTDVVMPGSMNGIELAEEVRRKRPELPIVLMSGYSKTASPEGAGFSLLRKPFVAEDLQRVVASTLDRKPARPARTEEVEEQNTV